MTIMSSTPYIRMYTRMHIGQLLGRRRLTLPGACIQYRQSINLEEHSEVESRKSCSQSFGARKRL